MRTWEILLSKTNRFLKLARWFRNLPFRTRNWIGNIWWKYMPGTVISVPWPSGWTPPNSQGVSCNSADPNDWFRPWLEQHVGRQNWDWNWELGDLGKYSGRGELLIKFRWGKSQLATAFCLTWMK